MITYSKTWKAFIANHSSTDEMNKAFHLIARAFNEEKSIIECTNAALGIYPGIFMILPIDSHKPVLFHHFNKAFSNPGIQNDMDEYYGLLSWDELPLAMKIEPTNLFALTGDGTLDEHGNFKTYFKDVDIDQLLAARDKEAFASIQEKNQGGKLYLRRCIPVPPFIALKLIDLEADSAHQMGAELAKYIGSIMEDESHELNTLVSSEEGKRALKTILAWLWKAPTNLDIRTIGNNVFPGSKIDKIARALQKEKLVETNQATTNNRDDTTTEFLLQTNVAIMQELLESRKNSTEKMSLSSEKGFQKLPNAIQSFLLAVGTLDLENPCEKITETGLQLLKMSNKNAIDELSRLLKKERKEDTNLDVAHMTEIISIKWFASHNPFIGISLCRMPPASKFSAASSFEKAEKLELLKELEIEKSEILTTLTDRSLYKPLSIDDLLSNISIAQGIIELYVGAESALAQKISYFYHAIRSNKSDIKLSLSSDENLLTKIQYVFDTRLNKWLERVYENSESLVEINHKLIDFESIVENILYGTFSTELPPNLLPSILNKKRTTPSPGDEKEMKKQKKKKGEVNENIIPEFKIKENEDWSMFTKDPNNLRPSSVCMMFHILGHCPQGKNCKRAKSHESLTDHQKKQTAAFIEDCRK
jgi:hypothetical protein